MNQTQLEAQGGVAVTDAGSLKRIRYWRPDGLEVWAVPLTKTYIMRKGGKVVESGVRDANLDQGWLKEKPSVLKLHCKGCGDWHETQTDVDSCIKSRRIESERMTAAQERFKELKADRPEAEAEQLWTEANGGEDRVDVLTKRVDAMDGKLDAILAALKGK